MMMSKVDKEEVSEQLKNQKIRSSKNTTMFSSSSISLLMLAIAKSSALVARNSFTPYVFKNIRLHSSLSETTSTSWELLTSTKNPTIKKIKTLFDKRKKRKELNLCAVEGYKLVYDLMFHSDTSHLVKHLLVSQDFEMNHFDEFNKLSLLLEKRPNTKVNFVTNEIVKHCSDTITPQGETKIKSIHILASFKYHR